MKNKKKLIQYIVIAAIIIMAGIYFLYNPISEDSLAEMLEKNNPQSAAILLLLL